MATTPHVQMSTQYRIATAADTGELGSATPGQLAAAREWIGDCSWVDLDPTDVDLLSDGEVVAGVDRHYTGGWSTFVRDTAADLVDSAVTEALLGSNSGRSTVERDFGPQHDELVTLLEQLAAMTPQQVDVLAEAHREQWAYVDHPPIGGPGARNWCAVRDALDRANRVRSPYLGPAWVAAGRVLRSASADRARFAVMDAVMAIVARDLVATVPGWTQLAYDAMVRPWRIAGPAAGDTTTITGDADAATTAGAPC